MSCSKVLIGAEATRRQLAAPPYDVATLALFLAGLRPETTSFKVAQEAINNLENAGLLDPDVRSMLVVTDLSLRTTKASFVDTDDYLLMVVLAYLIAKQALLNISTLTIVLVAAKKDGDMTTKTDVVNLFFEKITAHGEWLNSVLDTDKSTVTVWYSGEKSLKIHVFEQVEQTILSPILYDGAGKPRKARAEDLVGLDFKDANDNIRSLNKPLLTHVETLPGLVTFQCGAMDVPLAKLLLKQSNHIVSVSAGSGVNGGDQKPPTVASSFCGGLLLDEDAKRRDLVHDLKPELTRKLRVTVFLRECAGEKADALDEITYRMLAGPYIASPPKSCKPEDLNEFGNRLVLMLRLLESNAQTSHTPGTFVKVVAQCLAQEDLTIGDVLHLLGSTFDTGAVLYAALLAHSFVSNVIGVNQTLDAPFDVPSAISGITRLRNVSYTKTTRLSDIALASGIPVKLNLTQFAREMVGKSMPEHQGVNSFDDLFKAVLVGMAGRLCTTLDIARDIGVLASVPPAKPTVTDYGVYVSAEPVEFAA